MTPAARAKAAIDILDRVIEAAKGQGAPADRIVAEWAKANRYAGSKDRRAVRELVYDAIRHCGEVPVSGRAAMLALVAQDDTLANLFDGSQYGPEPIAEGEPVAQAGIAPGWLVERLAASGIEGEEAAALMGRAPLDIRVNTLRAERDAIDLPEPGEHLAAPNALRFDAGTQVDQWSAYREGRIEVQDHGSQMACLAAAVRAGETVVDLCAGAGGKTLALAAAMENRGRLIASDTDRRRLSQLGPRAQRAGATIIEERLLDPGREMDTLGELAGQADCVLIDAPCSGVGTWRRKPEAKWRLTPERLARFAGVQDDLLTLGARLVKPGGRLVFVTCSLLDEEGAARIAAFLASHEGWRADAPQLPLGRERGAGMRLSPFHDGTDGFFVARAHLPC
ncbi:RsmB/NOP family class I SAM-dependent RNA methyltransferase [Alteriqipengyuania lutimaris]|uniref:RsmB/NOP family class I SAM-dependent RNA methyltransferase n=1 Tax=Alteriqipengyuania lutimaris TaxID=1538146 RepID=A0A395LMF0_9SPHN|nr:RsmB/NOP family class I SAM-dependent RNA methyltransferase [Alteriqipengyuania lutimaris]MBB3032714.1 16S rRNA (cytosine967-C5)-methyltransferase [Alteriqipengyuania lutimaris]RDS78178.1 RsmB/NOP family class I SAM-dependent RNA methyltransferase [Alteriqipengyuania lutimaris]